MLRMLTASGGLGGRKQAYPLPVHLPLLSRADRPPKNQLGLKATVVLRGAATGAPNADGLTRRTAEAIL
jgi:hypothetical protein